MTFAKKGEERKEDEEDEEEEEEDVFCIGARANPPSANRVT